VNNVTRNTVIATAAAPMTIILPNSICKWLTREPTGNSATRGGPRL
jgi:hypothetical protein